MKTAIRDRLIERTVNPTSREPSSAAFIGGTPSSMRREIFSSTTIASSTTNPVAMVSAIRDRLLRLKPLRCMTPNVPIRDTGTATIGISVARQSRRKTNTTMITSAIEIASVLSTSRRLARMVGVRSSATCRSIALGIDACSRGRSAVTRSTVAMIFAFGCRFRISNTDGLPFADPALRRSCTESDTSATSDRRTAAPLR